MRQLLTLITLAYIAMIGIVAVAEAHPSDGYEPNDLPEHYGPGWGYSAAYNVGDLMFTEDFPYPEDLSVAERYIIAGLQSGPSGNGMEEWWYEVFMLVLAYESQHDELPEAITPEVIRSVSGNGEVSAARLELFKSPITGEYPRLDAEFFQPGQVYCRWLTAYEMEHIASVDSSLRMEWFGREVVDPKTEDVVPLEFASHPMLFRVYGESGVIYEGIRSLTINR